MAYTVFIYEGDEKISDESFSTLAAAFAHLGQLDFDSGVERCILDDGRQILFELRRNTAHGYLESVR